MALPETEKSTVLAAAEKVRRAVEDQSFAFGGNELSVTASIGVSHTKTYIPLGTLTGLAMSALEKAQQTGGNSVHLEMGEPDSGKAAH